LNIDIQEQSKRLASRWRELENVSIIKCDPGNRNMVGYSSMEDTPPVLHRQRMEVDFLRLIENKQQEN
jgi:hypothetical protein